ncbi:uncharacterized protein CDAR_439671 [Caerostris darwini]|uniref:Uncharacterized protein n=1 Tax=Caerostris darwini TaxID=1538125 RepID=A0AAV4RZT5_9ARAC|nr:uncharacterized protein CDAR_439671 [Caerostris darwini]
MPLLKVFMLSPTRNFHSKSIHFRATAPQLATANRNHRLRWRPAEEITAVAAVTPHSLRRSSSAFAAAVKEHGTTAARSPGPRKRKGTRRNRMTAARYPSGRDEFAGPCRVNTLPPLYPHCMRHQQHRCLYSNPPPPRPEHCRPHLPQACSDGHLESLQRRPSHYRHLRPAPPKLPQDGLVVLKVVSAACAEPDKKGNYEIVSVNERHGRFRKAVPCMPLALSILLCIVNMLAPGVGTWNENITLHNHSNALGLISTQFLRLTTQFGTSRYSQFL